MRENKRVRNVLLCKEKPSINQLDELDSWIAVLFGVAGSLMFFAVPYIMAVILI